jgi:hypothetical protein
MLLCIFWKWLNHRRAVSRNVKIDNIKTKCIWLC